MSRRRAHRGGWLMLGHELAKQRGAMVRVLAWSLPEALPSLFSGLLVARALDDGFLAHRPWRGLSWLAGLAVLLLIKAVATRRSFPWLCGMVEPLRDSLVRAVVTGTVHSAAMSTEAADAAGVARLTSQVEMVRQLVSALIRALRPLAFSLIAAIAGMIALSPPLAVIVLPPLALALLVFYLSLDSLSARRAEMVVAGEQIAREAGAVLTGLRDVIACGAQDRALADVGAAIDAQARASRAVAWAGSARIAVTTLGYYVPLIAILFAAPWLNRRGLLSTGQAIGAVTYLMSSVRPALASITGSVGAWGIQLGTVLQRLHAVYGTPRSPVGAPSGEPVPPEGSELCVRRLTFAYSATAEPVIRDLCVTLEDGAHLAVVGPSGIGKSTLASLLTGLRTGQRGEITFGGIPLDRIPEPVLRTQIALIPQEAYVFSGTLRENLTYLRPDAGPAELDACCEAIGLTGLLARLGGYDAALGAAGPDLSEGERQQIALGRVYLSRARLVILDEATCHLDPAAEAQVEQAFAERNGTLIVIAHRITSARRAQRILLLDGSQAMLGTHAQLLDNSGLYADLVGAWAPAPSRTSCPAATSTSG